ncbi:hypothetical protein NQ317_011053 [Molorchus minor]|uniref:Uncharacterized protein n=1 Tax=Molorchus minor TaxID=1323400 RepID=A0ABQ9IYC3_9CUCU|nr:hypothetical protein NQ317_011053 [Molorchus minor]
MLKYFNVDMKLINISGNVANSASCQFVVFLFRDVIKYLQKYFNILQHSVPYYLILRADKEVAVYSKESIIFGANSVDFSVSEVPFCVANELALRVCGDLITSRKLTRYQQILCLHTHTISVPLPQLIPQFLTPLRHVFFNTTLTLRPVSSMSNCKLNQPAELRDLGAVTWTYDNMLYAIDKFPGPLLNIQYF